MSEPTIDTAAMLADAERAETERTVLEDAAASYNAVPDLSERVKRDSRDPLAVKVCSDLADAQEAFMQYAVVGVPVLAAHVKALVAEVERWQKWSVSSDCEAPPGIPAGEVFDPLLENATLREQVAKLQAFKDWCHNYLDGKGIPHHPPGTHGAEGCRIGDRMDYVFAEIERLGEEHSDASNDADGLRERVAALEEVLTEAQAYFRKMFGDEAQRRGVFPTGPTTQIWSRINAALLAPEGGK